MTNNYSAAVRALASRLVRGSTPAAPAWNAEALLGKKGASWNYIDGCMLSSLLRLDESNLSFVKDFIDYFVREDGTLRLYSEYDYNLDNISEGRVLFRLFDATGEQKYRLALDTLRHQLDNQPRTPLGSFWHKKIYPEQVWLDGFYMAQPFSVEYALRFGGNGISDAFWQFVVAFDYMFDKQKKLLYHGWDCTKTAFWADKNGLSESFWLRAEGWFLAALADLCVILKNAGEKFSVLADIFREAAAGIRGYITDGMLWQVIDRAGEPGNYPEASGSLLVAYAFISGAKTVLPAEYATIGRELYESVLKRYLKTENGGFSLGGICLSAGLGPENNRRRNGTFEYYISEPVVENDAKGIGALLLCETEYGT